MPFHKSNDSILVLFFKQLFAKIICGGKTNEPTAVRVGLAIKEKKPTMPVSEQLYRVGTYRI